MSATAFQRMRREAAARKLAEVAEVAEVIEKEPTKKEIMEMLDEKGIEYNKKDIKPMLLELLKQAEEQEKEPDGGAE